ncbi:MAG TPA: type II toxin-antitoxin system Phd/YefM family antitoxin [Tepidisphaeraceae bacterium]|jgi:PHD/YefM family antitoxin component YafN of YafNO toxin-antitoxin module|nr:type II toxin-antitoxin system Phd/YefM family antitoxin [Tepidisphaeraceae bacterium]
MISTRHTQSLSDFRQKAAETLDRLNQTGEAEILTVNGEARAVLLAPAVYDEMAREAQLSHDTMVMRLAIQQIKNGQGREMNEALDKLREELMAKKKSRRGGADK